MAFLAPRRVGRPARGQVEPPVQRGVAGGAGVGQEDTHLAVVDLAQAAAPLAVDAAGFSPLLGEAAGVDDHDAVGLGQLLADMPPQLGHHGLVVPLAGADEELDRLAGYSGLESDRFARFALQAAEQAADNGAGVVAVLATIEPGQITLEEAGQTVSTGRDGGRREVRIVQENLGFGMVQERHRCASLPSPSPFYNSG